MRVPAWQLIGSGTATFAATGVPCLPPAPRPQVVENRIFSEGLHVLGQPPPPGQAAQYLAGQDARQLRGTQGAEQDRFCLMLQPMQAPHRSQE